MDATNAARQSGRMRWLLIFGLLFGGVAQADDVVWPLPACSAAEIASASPAPIASDTASLRDLPFVMGMSATPVAYIAGLDEQHRPVLHCFVAELSDWRLVAQGSVAAAGLVLSQPNAPNKAIEGGRYLLHISTNFGLSWVDPPPAFPLLADCRHSDGGSMPGPGVAPPLAPKPVSRVNPKYPALAELDGIEGQVEVWLDIFSDGSVSPYCFTGGTPPGWFENVALKAVSQWRFEPRTGMGRYRVTVKFRLR